MRGTVSPKGNSCRYTFSKDGDVFGVTVRIATTGRSAKKVFTTPRKKFSTGRQGPGSRMRKQQRTTGRSMGWVRERSGRDPLFGFSGETFCLSLKSILCWKVHSIARKPLMPLRRIRISPFPWMLPGPCCRDSSNYQGWDLQRVFGVSRMLWFEFLSR